MVPLPRMVAHRHPGYACYPPHLRFLEGSREIYVPSRPRPERKPRRTWCYWAILTGLSPENRRTYKLQRKRLLGNVSAGRYDLHASEQINQASTRASVYRHGASRFTYTIHIQIWRFTLSCLFDPSVSGFDFFPIFRVLDKSRNTSDRLRRFS
jgi:hypothetical protein